MSGQKQHATNHWYPTFISDIGVPSYVISRGYYSLYLIWKPCVAQLRIKIEFVIVQHNVAALEAMWHAIEISKGGVLITKYKQL